MAEEVFALSPISARAAQPSEADYDAIRDAFMETSRGRWFLGEYAKRNRNADTGMVLDAVARIEEALAAQHQQQHEIADNRGLEEALAAIRAAVDRATDAASAAVARLEIENNLAPVRKGTRIIREISWRWREIGADGRICDLIDSQIDAIDAGCARISELDPSAAVSEAFDLIKGSIRNFDRGNETATPEPQPVEMEASDASAPAAEQAPALELAETADVAEPVGAMADPDAMSAEAADAHDEAILDMVALEMAAPDPDEPPLHLASEPLDSDAVMQPPAAAPLAATEAPKSFVQPALPDPSAQSDVPEPSTPAEAEPQPAAVFEALPDAAPEAATEVSLGSTILNAGILPRPKTSVGDPLAPIRRMSQAEKIAFFS
jgi:hypothetical protein